MAMHIDDFNLPVSALNGAGMDIENLEGDPEVGGNIFKSLKHIKKFLHGVTRAKPSTVLKHLEKVLDYTDKYGRYVPGLNALVPTIAAVAKPIVRKGRKHLEKKGKAFVGGTAVAGHCCCGNGLHRTCIAQKRVHANKIRCAKFQSHGIKRTRPKRRCVKFKTNVVGKRKCAKYHYKSKAAARRPKPKPRRNPRRKVRGRALVAGAVRPKRRKASVRNPWLMHVNRFWKAHPGLDYRSVLIRARASYRG